MPSFAWLLLLLFSRFKFWSFVQPKSVNSVSQCRLLQLQTPWATGPPPCKWNSWRRRCLWTDTIDRRTHICRKNNDIKNNSASQFWVITIRYFYIHLQLSKLIEAIVATDFSATMHGNYFRNSCIKYAHELLSLNKLVIGGFLQRAAERRALKIMTFAVTYTALCKHCICYG